MMERVVLVLFVFVLSSWNTGLMSAPLNVDHVNVAHYNGHISLMWSIVNNDLRYSYILKYGVFEIPITDIYNQTSIVTYRDSYLIPGTTYDFTLYTVFDNVRSSGYNFSVTSPFRGVYCQEPWWYRYSNNVSEYGLEENGGRPQYTNNSLTVSVDFQSDTVSDVCRITGTLAVLTVVAVGFTLIIILIFVFLGGNRKIKKSDHRRSSSGGDQPTDHIYVNTSALTRNQNSSLVP